MTAGLCIVEEAKETGVTREMHPGMPTADAMSIVFRYDRGALYAIRFRMDYNQQLRTAELGLLNRVFTRFT